MIAGEFLGKEARLGDAREHAARRSDESERRKTERECAQCAGGRWSVRIVFESESGSELPREVRQTRRRSRATQRMPRG